jgi:hypothetical protein
MTIVSPVNLKELENVCLPRSGRRSSRGKTIPQGRVAAKFPLAPENVPVNSCSERLVPGHPPFWLTIEPYYVNGTRQTRRLSVLTASPGYDCIEGSRPTASSEDQRACVSG